MSICLCKMTKELSRQYRKDFENDPDIFKDMSRFTAYIYSEENADAFYDRQQTQGRIHLAVMRDEEPIGEVILKNIDQNTQRCTLSIHMKNDSVKNQGYGTTAEILTLQYAFYDLKMETVFADAILKNKRSQHVLKKAGFTQTHCDDTFCYFRCDKSDWIMPSFAK